MVEYLILFLIGFFICITSLLIGSTTPLYLTIMQILYPQVPLSSYIAADKFASMGRGIGAIYSFWSEINWRFIFKKGTLFFVSAFLGATLISEVSSNWVLPLLIVAFILCEFSEKISKILKQQNLLLFEFALGVYGGLLGTAIKPILLSIFRINIPADKKIMYLKIQIQTIMFFMVTGATISHFYHGNLLWEIALPLFFGNIIGGFVGGKILKRTGKLSGVIQKNIMRASFAIGIISSAWLLYYSPPS